MTRAITKIEASNSLVDLAARINAEHEAATAYMRRGLQRAIACGRLLIEVKAKLGHGQWLPFLRKYCRVPSGAPGASCTSPITRTKSANLPI